MTTIHIETTTARRVTSQLSRTSDVLAGLAQEMTGRSHRLSAMPAHAESHARQVVQQVASHARHLAAGYGEAACALGYTIDRFEASQRADFSTPLNDWVDQVGRSVALPFGSAVLEHSEWFRTIEAYKRGGMWVTDHLRRIPTAHKNFFPGKIGFLMAGLAFADGAFDQYRADLIDPRVRPDEYGARALARGTGRGVGTLVGGVAGAAARAVILGAISGGTLAPLGAVIGGMIGSAFGEWAGDKISHAFLDRPAAGEALDRDLREFGARISDPIGTAQGAIGAVGSAVGSLIATPAAAIGGLFGCNLGFGLR